MDLVCTILMYTVNDVEIYHETCRKTRVPFRLERYSMMT